VELASFHRSGTQNFELAPRYWKICGLQVKVIVSLYFINRLVLQMEAHYFLCGARGITGIKFNPLTPNDL
jgi:hypothetical protein